MELKSVFKYAAEAGVPMGLYLTAISMCLLASIRIPQLPLLMLPLLAGVPVVLYRILRRIRNEQPAYRRVATLWLIGIYIFIFGTLICTLISSLYVVILQPHFVYDYVSQALAVYDSTPQLASLAGNADMMREAMARHMLPSGLQFVASLGWSTCFFGSLLSFAVACILAPKRRLDDASASNINR